jgi:SAM-dependent methyltransferase
MKKKKKKIISRAVNSWSHYWQSQTGSGSGCLPEAPVPVANLIEKIWHDFFENLASGTKVLDLGTGSGIVLQQARSVRADLDLTGVDYATGIPAPDMGVNILSGVKIEEMPLADKSFGAITSQFGIEYAPFPQGIREVKRVAEKNAQCMFLCHHADSIIIQQNSHRVTLLKEFVAANNLFDKAIKACGGGKGRIGQERQNLARLLDRINRIFPNHTALLNDVAARVATIMSEEKSIPKLLALRQDIEMEIKRITVLRKAALTREKVLAMAEILGNGENGKIKIVTCCLPDTQTPLAWQISINT